MAAPVSAAVTAPVAAPVDADKKNDDNDACLTAGPIKVVGQYNPKGVTKTLKAANNVNSNLTDLEVYYSKDIDPNDNIKNAVIIFYDIFGWNTTNKNVFEFADKLQSSSNNKYYVLMPDIYRGEPWPVNKQINKDEITKWWKRVATYDIVCDDMINRIIPSLKSNGINKICFVGQCWGGLMMFMLGECILNYSDMFIGGLSVHGSRINDDLCQKIKIPIFYAPTPKDYPLDNVKKILDTKDFGNKCIYKCYDNMGHGFTAGRGDFKNKDNLDAVNDVVAKGSDFFKTIFGV